jgi:hypothetical protein
VVVGDVAAADMEAVVAATEAAAADMAAADIVVDVAAAAVSKLHTLAAIHFYMLYSALGNDFWLHSKSCTTTMCIATVISILWLSVGGGGPITLGFLSF